MQKKVMKFGNYSLEFGNRTLIMGIVNITPDSFYDGGQFLDSEKAIAQGLRLAKEGTDIIDIGGESTRPGSEAVSQDEELKRVIPVIEGLVGKIEIPISIDTCNSEVAKKAIESGASMINDISAARFDPKIVDVAKEYEVPLALMHMKGTPKNMQSNPTYDSVMGEIKEFLMERVGFAVTKGVSKENILIDPGIGFGKTLEHNYEIIRNLGELKELELPILVGPSRKSFIGKTLDLPVEERLEGTLASVTICIMNGADIVRVHDVKEVERAVKMTDAIHRN